MYNDVDSPEKDEFNVLTRSNLNIFMQSLPDSVSVKHAEVIMLDGCKMRTSNEYVDNIESLDPSQITIVEKNKEVHSYHKRSLLARYHGVKTVNSDFFEYLKSIPDKQEVLAIVADLMVADISEHFEFLRNFIKDHNVQRLYLTLARPRSSSVRRRCGDEAVEDGLTGDGAMGHLDMIHSYQRSEYSQSAKRRRLAKKSHGAQSMRVFFFHREPSDLPTKHTISYVKDNPENDETAFAYFYGHLETPIELTKKEIFGLPKCAAISDYLSVPMSETTLNFAGRKSDGIALKRKR